MTRLDKTTIRKKKISLRQAMGAEEIEVRSKAIFKTFLENAHVVVPRDSDAIALYSPIRGEVDTRCFYGYFRNQGKHCIFPRVKKDTNALEFCEVADWSELRLGSYGISEPQTDSAPCSQFPDLVLVPGVAFTRNGHRLGFGAGYYDRAIERWIHSAHRDRMRLIGLAYDFQIVDSLPTEAHDHTLDFILTENNLYERSDR